MKYNRQKIYEIKGNFQSKKHALRINNDSLEIKDLPKGYLYKLFKNVIPAQAGIQT